MLDASHSDDSSRLELDVRPRNIFLCYASLDQEYVHRLKHYSAPVIKARMADLRLWEDSSIFSGEAWSDSIQQAIDNSIAAVIFVSDNLLNSSYVMEHEMPRFLARAEAGQFEILCFYIRECLVDEYLFDVPVNGSMKQILLTKYQGLNSPKQPLDSIRYRYTREGHMVAAARKFVATLKRMQQPRLRVVRPDE